jgi:hypothetical protein
MLQTHVPGACWKYRATLQSEERAEMQAAAPGRVVAGHEAAVQAPAQNSINDGNTRVMSKSASHCCEQRYSFKELVNEVESRVRAAKLKSDSRSENRCTMQCIGSAVVKMPLTCMRTSLFEPSPWRCIMPLSFMTLASSPKELALIKASVNLPKNDDTSKKMFCASLARALLNSFWIFARRMKCKQR